MAGDAGARSASARASSRTSPSPCHHVSASVNANHRGAAPASSAARSAHPKAASRRHGDAGPRAAQAASQHRPSEKTAACGKCSSHVALRAGGPGPTTAMKIDARVAFMGIVMSMLQGSPSSIQ